MNEQELQELALQVQKHSPGTTARRKTLSKLIEGIYRMCEQGNLCHPYSGQFDRQVYKDIYDEAVQNLCLYICQKIDTYNPERARFLNWINMLLNRRFFSNAIPSIIGRANEINFQSIENFDDVILRDNNDEDNSVNSFLKIRQYIETDPEDIFNKASMRKYPQVNFRDLAIKRWSGVCWQDISEEYNIQVSTLSNFYQRNLKRFRDKFRDLES